ncbi:hypothetical protein [Bradyrhizobium canariense]|uniref:hypothetical protein n=1 Tax=Bradyrhizobium canariense TaxID=255045 RepID=UPI003D9ACA6C
MILFFGGNGGRQFFDEGCSNGHSIRGTTTVTLEDCTISSIIKAAMRAVRKNEPRFSELFLNYVLVRNSGVEEDLIDQLFNSSERRLARPLLIWRISARRQAGAH